MYPLREINLGNILSNLSVVQNTVGKAKVCVILKADAYGHGIIPIANTLKDKASYFGVARICEALSIRQAGIATPILVLGAMEYDMVSKAIKNNITLTIMDERDALISTNISQALKQPLNVHLKINTGMNRYGAVNRKTIEKIALLINKSRYCTLEGVYTHFSCPYTNPVYTEGQFERFKYLTSSLDVPLRHCASTDALTKSQYHLDMVRAGLSVYGYSSDSSLPLSIAMRVKASIGKIYKYPMGASIGYERAFRLPKPRKIAVVQIGYGDGMPRMQSKGSLFINGMLCDIVGNVCMDLTMIDVSSLKRIREGDVAEIISNASPANILARHAGTITYDVLTCWQERVQKVYIN